MSWDFQFTQWAKIIVISFYSNIAFYQYFKFIWCGLLIQFSTTWFHMICFFSATKKRSRCACKSTQPPQYWRKNSERSVWILVRRLFSVTFQRFCYDLKFSPFFWFESRKAVITSFNRLFCHRQNERVLFVSLARKNW